MELGLRIQKFEFGGGRGERAAKQIGEDPESRDFGKTKRDRRWQKTTRQAQNTVQAATCSRQSRRLPAWRLLLADWRDWRMTLSLPLLLVIDMDSLKTAAMV